MKRLFFNLIIPIIAVIAMSQIASAQPITAPAVRTLSNGGARVLSAQGGTAADPAIGFTGHSTFPANLNDVGGGNGIFRPLNTPNTMAFSTLSTERMRILSSGRIGIGTTAPTTKLNVGTASSNDGIRVNQTGTTSASLSLQAATGKNWALFSTGSGNSQGAGHLTFHDWTANVERMRIASSGNVGIGISDPKQKLHVAGGMMLAGPTPLFGGPMVLFSESVAANPVSRWGIEYVRAATPGESGVNFWIPWDPNNTAPGNHHLFLRDEDGKVGVGVDPNPALYPNAPNGPFPLGYRLYVKEGIITEKLKIAGITTNQWFDHVFAPDYKLKPLSEVEAFVKANKHLPNVPSAQEIEDDGLDVAHMLARQMEKIEELMLHTIELNKRVEKLEAENAALKQLPTTTVNH